MERSAAYKWAGHVVPGSWLDWEDHMAHAGEEGDGAGVGVGEWGAGSEGGGRGARLRGRGRGRGRRRRAEGKGAQSPDACADAERRNLLAALLLAPPALSITNSAI